MTAEERLAKLEKRIDEFDAMIARLMMLAARNPLGRKILKDMSEAGR